MRSFGAAKVVVDWVLRLCMARRAGRFAAPTCPGAKSNADQNKTTHTEGCFNMLLIRACVVAIRSMYPCVRATGLVCTYICVCIYIYIYGRLGCIVFFSLLPLR